MIYIVQMNRFRQYAFISESKRDFAYKFAKRFDLEVKPVKEIPFCVNTIYP